MKPYEIFRRLSSSEVDALVLAACEDDDIPDKIAGSVITLQRVPLHRLERAHEDVRKGYVRKSLRDKRAEDLALFVLSAALTRLKAEMIEAFLAALDLPHEGPSLTADGPVAGAARAAAQEGDRRPRRGARRPRRRGLPERLRRAARRLLAVARGAPRRGREPRDRRPLRELRAQGASRAPPKGSGLDFLFWPAARIENQDLTPTTG